MKKKFLFIAVAATISIQSNAEYLIKYNVEPSPNSITIKGWFDTSSLISEWLNTGIPFDCGTFTPSENTITIGQSFEQSRNCSINQERTIQNRKISENGTYKNEGSPIIETRVSSLIENNNSVGSLETWFSIEPEYSEWINSGEIYGCTNWSPLANTINNGQSFPQTATDCKQDQTRNKQNKEQENTTLEIRNIGFVVESRTLTGQTNTRNSTGTKLLKECKYENGPQNYYSWNQGSDSWLGPLQSINWGTQLIYFQYAPIINSYTHSGYLYTRGNYVTQTITSYDGILSKEKVTKNIYYVCREQI